MANRTIRGIRDTIPPGFILGRQGSSAGRAQLISVKDLAVATIKSGGVAGAIPVFTATSNGLAPASGGGATKFLRADGTFVVPPTSGGINTFYPPSGLTLPTTGTFTASFSGPTGTFFNNLAGSRGVSIGWTTPAASNNFLYAHQAVLSSTTFTLTAFTLNNWIADQAFELGIAVRDSTGKLQSFGFRNNSGSANTNIYSIFNYSVFANPAPTVTTFGGGLPNHLPLWLRVQLTGGNFVYSVSMDGEVFNVVTTIAANSFLGTTLSDCGIECLVNGQRSFSGDIFSWTNTNP